MSIGRVLSIAYDPTLAKIRDLILRNAGYEVRSVIASQAGMAAADEEPFE